MRCTRLLALSTEKVKPTGNFGCPRCGQSDARSGPTDNRCRDANFHTGRLAKGVHMLLPVGAARSQSGSWQAVERLPQLACLRVTHLG
jgi:hypothetical protein